MEILGHRGARFEAPENTITGFKYALGIGIDRFELDVHLTKDGELAVIHDATVDRTTNGTGQVSNFTLEELQKLDARSTFPEWPEPAVIPSLRQVFETIAHVRYAEIEIKSDAPERLDMVLPKVAELMREFGVASKFYVTSFDQYALELAQKHAPEIKRGYICSYNSTQNRLDAERLGASLCGFPYASATDELVAWAKSTGKRIVGWPTNDEAALDTAVRWQVDCICTDAPSRMRMLLSERGITED